MSELSRLVDACLLPAFNGLSAPGWLLQRLGDGLGGVTLFARNVQSVDQVRELTGQLRAAAPQVLIAIDEEGGDVTRLEVATGSSYPGNLALGAVDDVAATRQVAAAIGVDLRAAGINLNLGPVADVNSNPDNPVIGVRSFGADAALVSRHTAAYVEGLQSAGVAACTKHFPGHGDTSADSHHELPTVSDSPAALQTALEPFRAAIAAGTHAIMTAHIVVPAYGADPATINSRILTGLLREELGYTGLVVTDALDMGAIRRGVGDVEGAIRALAAGADSPCLSGREEIDVLDAIRAGVAAAVTSGRLPFDRLAQAAGRVAATAAWAAAAVPATAERSVGLRSARRAIVVNGNARLGAGTPLIVQLSPVANMAAGEMPWGPHAPLRDMGCDAAFVEITEAVSASDPLAGHVGGPVVLVVRDARRHPWQQAVLERLLSARPDTIVVEMGLAGQRPAQAAGYLLTHGAGRVNAVAAAEVLLGCAGGGQY